MLYWKLGISEQKRKKHPWWLQTKYCVSNTSNRRGHLRRGPELGHFLQHIPSVPKTVGLGTLEGMSIKSLLMELKTVLPVPFLNLLRALEQQCPWTARSRSWSFAMQSSTFSPLLNPSSTSFVEWPSGFTLQDLVNNCSPFSFDFDVSYVPLTILLSILVSVFLVFS